MTTSNTTDRPAAADVARAFDEYATRVLAELPTVERLRLLEVARAAAADDRLRPADLDTQRARAALCDVRPTFYADVLAGRAGTHGTVLRWLYRWTAHGLPTGDVGALLGLTDGGSNVD